MNESPHGASRARWRRLCARASVAALAAFWVAGCVIDPDDKCGPNQVLWGDDDRCVCAEGFGYTATGCVACGENEVSVLLTGTCSCAEGYARDGATGPCEPIPMDIGVACTTDADCNAAFPHCQPHDLGSYCTSTGCTTTGDCEAGYACDTTATPSYCKRPPVGLLQPCESDADCEGTEALYCDTFFSHACLVRDCSLQANDCFEGNLCCDGSPYSIPNLCLPSCDPPV